MKKTDKYYWLDEVLKPDEPLSPPPYGWTRLRARLQERNSANRKNQMFFKLAYPVVFFLVITSALLVGQQLSRDYLHLQPYGANTQNRGSSVDPVASCCSEEFIQTSEIIK